MIVVEYVWKKGIVVQRIVNAVLVTVMDGFSISVVYSIYMSYISGILP